MTGRRRAANLHRMWARGWVVAAVVAFTLVDAAPALATHQRLVTIAARVCPSYESITANLARNNIQESLRDLGDNSPYGRNNVPILMHPEIEAQFQPDCTPLQGWRFKLGTGYQTKADVGVWGALSRVTGGYAQPEIITKAHVPLRDEFGQPLPGNVELEGAETIHLTNDQVDQADSLARLWIQGGVPGQPITGDPDLYAFGALRCATDILNGDNVEFIAYPGGGVNHVFCYAYYVSPAPTSGTIIVEKQMVAPAGTPPQTFRFTGNISYETEGGTGVFDLTASPNNPGAMSFVRAAGSDEWNFEEEVPGGWTLEDPPRCVSSPAPGGASSTYTVTGSRVSVALAEGDTMRCTFVNHYTPPVAGLLIRKVTRGALGTFDFSVDPGSFNVSATTLSEGVAYNAQPELTDLAPGRYTISEQLPQSNAGEWSRRRAYCGQRLLRSATPDIEVDIPAGTGQVCTFVNRFTHAGAIRITKRTLNADATTRFQIRPRDDPEVEFQKIAETTADGPPVVAQGDRTTAIPLGTYAIQETTASVEGNDGLWRVNSVVCDGIPVPSVQGRVRIRLTPENPKVNCAFTNEFIRRDPPPEPPDPEPPEPPVPPGPVPNPSPGGIAGETTENPAELRVSKSASPRRVAIGQVARYRVIVRNRGPAAARHVTLAEVTRARRGVVLSARASQGRCFAGRPRYCSFGRVRAGERVVVTVRARPDRLGRVRNIVAVNTGTEQRTRRGKVARAAVVVVPRPIPRFTG